MYRSAVTVVASLLCVLNLSQTQAESKGTATEKGSEPTIVVTKLSITGEMLELKYDIRNDSGSDIWICEEVNLGDCDSEAFISEGTRTLLIRRRLDVPLGVLRNQPIGRYARLRARQRRTESLLLPLPVHFRTVFVSGGGQEGYDHASGLAVEIGYYVGDLPGIIRVKLGNVDKSTEQGFAIPDSVGDWIGSVLDFNESNGGLLAGDEHVVVPWTNQVLRGEHIMKTTAANLHIPYSHEMKELSPPDISLCARADIQYKPSMFEYFFPYASERNLLSQTEREYLKSSKTTVVKNQDHLKAFARDVGKGLDGGIVTEFSEAHVICYCDGERLTSFTVYDDRSIETEDRQRFRYSFGLPSMRVLTRQILPFDLRKRCAANLKDLWNRVRFYHKAEKTLLKNSSSKSGTTYPTPAAEWCDAMVQAYESVAILGEYVIRPHACPSAAGGNNHYAMNPNCRPDSPADMVLLFETKAGWNQHGGPELFTFDNHDPKGGCVLLNDGTVKFIRTAEELRQLRWE